MTVTVNIRRSDLARLNLSMMFRLPANLYLFLFLWAVALLSIWYGGDDFSSKYGIDVALVTSLAIAIPIFLAVAVVSILFSTLGATSKSGVLGLHTFSIEEGGLREITDANETLNRWSSIRKVLKTGGAILVQINWYLFHVIPRRDFESPDQFEAFFNECESRWKNAT